MADVLRALIVISVLTPSFCAAQLNASRLIELRVTSGTTSVDSASAFAALRRGLERDGAFHVLNPTRPSDRAIENAEFLIQADGYRFQGRTFFKITGVDRKGRRRLPPETIRVRDSVTAAFEAVGVRIADRLITDVARRNPSTTRRPSQTVTPVPAQATATRLIELRVQTGNTGVDSATVFAALKRGLEGDGTFRVLDAAPSVQRAFENTEFVLYANGAMTRGLYFYVYAEDTIKNRRLSLATGRVGRDSVVAALEALGVSMASRLVRDAGWIKLPAKEGPLLTLWGAHLGSPAGASLTFGVLYTLDDLLQDDALRGPFASIEPGFRAGRASIGHVYVKFNGVPVGGTVRASFLRKYAGSGQQSYLGVEAHFIFALLGVRMGVFQPLRGDGRALLSWDVGWLL